MGHVGDIVPYYLRQISDIDLFNGQTVGLSIVHAGLSLVTCLVLLALASLTIRARPERPAQRGIRPPSPVVGLGQVALVEIAIALG